jgi:arylsulfatase A-like enzyme
MGIPLRHPHTADILSESGLYTALFGMQHETSYPSRLGFEEFDVSNSYCEYVVENATRWLLDPPKKPVLLTAGFFETHRPYPRDRYERAAVARRRGSAQVYDELFSGVDLLPTLLDLLGIDIPDEIDGMSHAHNLLATPKDTKPVRTEVDSTSVHSTATAIVDFPDAGSPVNQIVATR